MLGSRISNFARQFTTSAIRRGGHGGTPGENLPFSIDNRFKVTALFILFFGSGLAAPFLVLRHQMLKK
uniref:Cytochrome c oxidase subunit 7C, mitochondrial n=1 Tax=Riptortus pedestris TaxID=329032 RepID=R4WE45_RIPPE|nr:unkown protein [Riptortus pedestris]